MKHNHEHVFVKKEVGTCNAIRLFITIKIAGHVVNNVTIFSLQRKCVSVMLVQCVHPPGPCMFFLQRICKCFKIIGGLW